ncbi:unnamed protein product [Ilex paraguariensis]|uniref:Dirigent protein n=1 Tax=Ilex paraguariensis TaxID=185542 RepID=A0ABC8SYQ3_9AQUA
MEKPLKKKKMKGRIVMTWLWIVGVAATSVKSDYYSDSVPHEPKREKETHLHFFIHDIITGKNPTALKVAQANLTGIDTNPTGPTPFGSTFVVDDPLTTGPDPTSEVIGNAQGAYVSSSQGKDVVLVLYLDFGFTTGKFNGSSISVFSRNPITEPERELAVVGGRGKFRMARGFAKLKTYSVNPTLGNAVVEYHVTVLHY